MPLGKSQVGEDGTKHCLCGGFAGSHFMSHMGQADSRGTPKTLYPSERLLQSDGKRSPPMDSRGMLDWSNGFL